MKNAVAFVSGLVFAIGLGLSGMTQPTKVLGFLDVFGAWDPSLAFVMVGAIGVHFIFVRMVRGRHALPEGRTIDARLIIGAALFGIGWGVAGYCPGPAVVSVVTLRPTALAFVASMLVGMGAYELLFRKHAVNELNAD